MAKKTTPTGRKPPTPAVQNLPDNPYRQAMEEQFKSTVAARNLRQELVKQDDRQCNNYTSNDYEKAARESKAIRIAAGLFWAGIPASMMRTAVDEQWKLAASMMGQNPPGDETKAMILKLLARREKQK